MHGPEQPIDDSVIKRLLISCKVLEQGAGLRLMDQKYRDLISDSIRRWSSQWQPRLTSDDLAEIWQQTMISVARKVRNGRFQEQGRLEALLRKIARRRAVDRVRKRARKRGGIVYGLDVDPASDISQPSEFKELCEELERCYDSLSEKLALVMRVDVSLCINGGFKWVSIGDLTKELNRVYGLQLTEAAVKSRRQSARVPFRELLKRRGYGE